MKRRTFLMTLLLFLFTIHFGIMLIAIHTYRDTMGQAKERSSTVHYFIASGLLRDIAALDSRGADYKQGIADLSQPYGILAENQKAGIALYDGNTLVYLNLNGEGEPDLSVLPHNGDRRIALKKNGDRLAVWVAGRLPEPYNNYALVYDSDISSTLHGWYRMKNTMFGAGLIVSGFLGICLLLLLGRLFQPLSDISNTSRRIAEGDYETRLTIKGSDELAAMAQSFNHMTDEIQRQMEELVATAENKQLFIDNFAHELKTPLTTIYGYAEYLQRAAISEDEKHFALACILSESSRMQTMAYQMMELANLRSDQIHMEHLSLEDLFQKVKQAMLLKASEKKIDLLFYCEISKIYGDSNLLESLLVNLIDNAIKASNPGSPILVKAFEYDGAPMITVEDKGKGIPQEALSQVTQPYYRVEKHRHRRDGGAGLGLAICEQIVARHKAKLALTSSLGTGTTATITFTTST